MPVGEFMSFSDRNRAGGTRPSLLRTRRALCAAVAAAIALLTLGCSSPSPVDRISDENSVRMTVVRYDRLLTEGYRSMDMSRLRQVATELQAEDEYVHMSALGEGGVRLLPVLNDFEFLEVSVEGATARVQTREAWDYRHEDRVSREVTLVQEDLVYTLAWTLERDPSGRWFVSDLRAVDATESRGETE